MKRTFTEKLRLNKANKIRLKTINGIIEEYQAQGYVMTLRQLYYQLVSRDIIPNQQKEYAKLSGLLVQGRMAGVVDWRAIEDRIRVPYLPYFADSVPDAINDIIGGYRLNRMEGQEKYIEVWCEKDALSNVLKRVTSFYHINLMVNRGYSSCSAMHDAYQRFSSFEEVVVLYLGDHDPSGLDMIRDIEKRLGQDFGLEDEGIPFRVIHVALTDNQIEEYSPPPNPTKTTDPRAGWYMDKYGDTCWEVDALKPEVLNGVIEENIKDLIDIELFKKILKQEEKDKKTLRKLTKNFNK